MASVSLSLSRGKDLAAYKTVWIVLRFCGGVRQRVPAASAIPPSRWTSSSICWSDACGRRCPTSISGTDADLVLIYAALRPLSPDGIVAYQIGALLIATATAFVIV